MKQIFTTLIVVIVLSSTGHPTPVLSEFRVYENQSVAEVFKNLSEAHKESGTFQILVAPEIVERELKELVLRNIDFEKSIQLICEKTNYRGCKKESSLLLRVVVRQLKLSMKPCFIPGERSVTQQRGKESTICQLSDRGQNSIWFGK